MALVGRGACLCWDPFLRVLGGVPEGIYGGRSAVLAPTPFAHQVSIRLQQCCVVLVGVYLATPVVCWRFRCFLPGSWLGITGRHGTVTP